MIMKNLIVSTLIFLFVFSTTKVTFAENSESEEIKLLEKQVKLLEEQVGLTKYQLKSKSSLAAAGIAFFTLPSLGHAYAGEWERGLIFLLLEGGAFAGSLWAYDEYEDELGFVLLVIVFPALRVGEAIDAYLTASRYNSWLQDRYKINLSWGKDSATLRLSYAF
jgi:hypothetical protein